MIFINKMLNNSRFCYEGVGLSINKVINSNSKNPFTLSYLGCGAILAVEEVKHQILTKGGHVLTIGQIPTELEVGVIGWSQFSRF